MSAGHTLFRMVRKLSRPDIAHGSVDPTYGRMAAAVEAVHAVKERGIATINEVAAELGIDQSGASRLMSQAISAGYVQRERAAKDGRARECGLTPAGEELLREARDWQEGVFARLTADWSDTERSEFEAQIVRLLSASDRAE